MSRIRSPFRFLPVAVLGFPLITTILSCRKDKPEQPVETPVTIGNEHGVYITNEGNFQWGNASVSWYNKADGQAVEDLYAPANGSALGDVLQSMTLHGGKGYLVVNNSGKVVVVDQDSFRATATIAGFTSPRYLLPVGGNKAYVSEMQGNKLRVLDLAANAIVGTITCRGWTEEMALAAGKVFITNETRKYVYVVDPATDAVADSIAVSSGGNSIVEDANGKLWVACKGGGGTPPALCRIDPATLQKEATFNFAGSSANPWRLAVNGDGHMLYFLNGDVFRMAIADDALPNSPFIAAEGRNFYGLGVDPGDGTVYVADAIDYTQRGRVFRYSAEGVSINDFPAGRIPGGFVFR
ncbi:MAG: YncE family protein [Bacteroidetes bacterium]|nr:YncE family protein [Bacteroidota bacterium]